MTGSEYIAGIQKRVNQQAMNKAVMSSSIAIVADMAQRIFVSGKNSKGALIGKYDTGNEIYVPPLATPKKIPLKGKDGKTKFKNGNSHKTSYFESYSEFKKKVSGKNDKVNLRLFGILQSNFATSLRQEGNASVVTLTDENAKKAEGNEERFGGKIFSLTKSERAKYTRMVKAQFKIYAK